MLWTKPSGMEIETNDLEATIEYCKSLGWTEAGKKAGPKAKKKHQGSGHAVKKTLIKED